MPLRLSTGLRNFVNSSGSMKDGLQNGQIQIYTGAQPATADTAPSGTLLATITQGSAARTAEVLATGSVTLATGAAGSVDTITVNGVSILDAPVAYVTSLTATATLVATAINSSASNPEYTATASGAVVTIRAKRGSGAGANSFIVTGTLTTLTATYINMGSGVTAVNGLKFGFSAAGVLDKHATQVWTGVAAVTGTAGWFRYVGSVADGGATDTAEAEFRMDGAISTSGAQINMSNTTITAAATETVSSFPLTLPTS